jgi:hypothetical protein
MAGRTLLQHALPVTFGLKAAGWMVALTRRRIGSPTYARPCSRCSWGGAAGTVAWHGSGRYRGQLRARARPINRCCRGTPTGPGSPNQRRAATAAGACEDRRDITLSLRPRSPRWRRRLRPVFGDAAQAQPVASVSAYVMRARPRPGGDAVCGDGAGA